jgi:hypothetical protein
LLQGNPTALGLSTQDLHHPRIQLPDQDLRQPLPAAIEPSTLDRTHMEPVAWRRFPVGCS